jgi:STE24 endopeptidase
MELVCAAAALGLLAFTPAAPWMVRLAYASVGDVAGAFPHALALTVVVLGVGAAVEASMLPASLYVALHLNPRYRGHAVETPEDVVGAHVQALAVLLPAGLAAGGLILVTQVVAGPMWWWLVAGPLFALALAWAVHVGPAVLAGLGRVRPIERADLERRLADVAAQAGVRVTRIRAWDVGGAGATALITGVGPRRQIFIAREILRHWSDDEIVVVVAHELGHAARGDLWRTLLLNVAAVWVSLLACALLVRPSAAATVEELVGQLPAIAFVSLACWSATAPVRHAYSRRQERLADRFALELTGRGDALKTTLRRLGSQHLAEENPSLLTRWLHLRHPSVGERIAAAESFAERKAASGR